MEKTPPWLTMIPTVCSVAALISLIGRVFTPNQNQGVRTWTNDDLLQKRTTTNDGLSYFVAPQHQKRTTTKHTTAKKSKRPTTENTMSPIAMNVLGAGIIALIAVLFKSIMDDLSSKIKSIKDDLKSIKDVLKSHTGVLKSHTGVLTQVTESIETLQENVRMLIGVSAYAQEYKAKAAIMIDDNDDVVEVGARCTWTVFTKNRTSYLVVTAKHCALPHKAVDSAFAFVPKAIAMSGIELVGFTSKDSAFVQDDIIIFKLKRKPLNLQGTPLEYRGANVSMLTNDEYLVYGRGASDMVEGAQLVKSTGTSEHYVTIVKRQELGNSGTAMFQAVMDGSPARPIGVWSGTSQEKGMHARGYIAPFPQYDDIVWVEPKQQPETKNKSYFACDCKTPNNYKTAFSWKRQNGTDYISLDPDCSDPYGYGIFLGEFISYSGKCDTIDPSDGSLRKSALA
jgi:hypothetical protein